MYVFFFVCSVELQLNLVEGSLVRRIIIGDFFIYIHNVYTRLPVRRDRIRRLATDPVVMSSSPATDIYVVHCWLITQIS